jgi:hypothetical protein
METPLENMFKTIFSANEYFARFAAWERQFPDWRGRGREIDNREIGVPRKI